MSQVGGDHAVLAAVASTPAFASLAAALSSENRRWRVGGAAGALPASIIAALANRFGNRLWVLAAESPGEANAYTSDLETLLGTDTCVVYPQREGKDGEPDASRADIDGRRVEAVEALLSGRARIMVATQRALQEVAPIPSHVADLRYTVHTGQETRLSELVDALDTRGFLRVPIVERAGHYAVRGGLVDLFSFGAADPVRIEFWGDDIESIRHFDILDQRSTDTVQHADILPVRLNREGAAAPTRCSILERLPADTVLAHPGAVPWQQQAQSLWDEAELRFREATLHNNPATAPSDRLLSPAALAAQAERHPQIVFVEEHVGDVVFQSQRPPPLERMLKRLRMFLKTQAEEGARTLILCDNSGQRTRLEELLHDRHGRPPADCHLVVGALTAGFRLLGASPPMNVLTDHEIFRRERKLRRQRRFRGAASLESLAQLSPGDYIVHMDHGIGQFQKLERVDIGGESIEALAVTYGGNEVLRIPVYRLDRVERWVGAHPEDKPPSLHRIGGKRWTKLRQKTEAAIRQMTAELLELYATRKARSGHRYSPDTRWQREMEEAFLYEDTPDQRQAVDDIKRDMESPRVMDRLVCGDAGYGKTEVAIRAAFKAVQDGKQVAVLAPTTVLVAQHAKTFGDRLAEYPVVVQSLSRFEAPARQREVLAGLRDGTIDIVIGTHRILSGDTCFKELGLLIIDEEQRLGVRQKDQLKRLRTTVDVLTLTATPIPRTLYMSLAGIRDLSLIRTPPRDRMAVMTHIIPWSDQLITQVCRQELDRGGQVFFLHNRVATIESAATRVRDLVGSASVEVAHGQMHARKLEAAMTRFVEGRTDILVCSSIIENGLDVANANTLIVTDADHFGLSQLYQIRGRVGRWDRRAYCYLVVDEAISDAAEKRLQVLEHYTELGSGYQIAMRDLEVRGAGNLLGEDQSGFAHAVGLDTYMRMMESTLKIMRDGPDPHAFARPDVSMDDGAYLPDSYMADQHQKLHFYRRLARLQGRRELGELTDELKDRYGRPPPEVQRLLQKTLLGIAGARSGVQRIRVYEQRAHVTFRANVVPRMSALGDVVEDADVTLDVQRITPLSLVFSSNDRGRLIDATVSAVEALRPDATARGHESDGEIRAARQARPARAGRC